MMMRQYKLFILIFQAIITVTATAGFERIPQPAAVFGKGGSGVSLFDDKNLWLNPSSLSATSAFQSTIFYSPSPFQLPQLSNTGFAVANNFDLAVVGFGMTTVGFSLYRETAVTIAAADTLFESMMTGISLHVNHVSIERYGARTTVGIDLGFIIPLTENIYLGTSLLNLNRPSLSNTDDDIPQQFISGISYQFTRETFISFDIVKDARYPLTYKTAIQFLPHDILILRAGFVQEPSQIFGGLGIVVGNIQIDYGIGSHPELGLTHSFGVSFHQ